MAEQIEIRIGNDTVKVPEWASEETLKNMSKFSEATAKATTELLKQWDSGNKVAKQNQKSFKKIAAAAKSSSDNQADNNNKFIKQASKAYDKIGKSAEKTASRTTAILESFEKGTLSGLNGGLQSVLPTLGLIGGLAGSAAAVLDTFINSVTGLTNVGAGLSTDLQNLRANAAKAGMTLADYTEFVVSNGEALRVLGRTSEEGAVALSKISQDIRRSSLANFNAFGMTVAELNEVMIQEIELRRLAGRDQSNVTAGLTDAFNKLMVETMGMAAVTGADKRELMRSRMDAMSDSEIALGMDENRAGNFGNLKAMLTGLAGEQGAQIATAIGQSYTSGRSFEAINEQVTQMNQLSGGRIREIYELFMRQGNTTDTAQFSAELRELLGGLEDSIGQSNIQTALSLSPDRPEAKALLDFIADLRGLETLSTQEVLDIYADTEQGIRDANGLAIKALTADAVNRGRAIALNTAIDGLEVILGDFGGDLGRIADAMESVVMFMDPNDNAVDLAIKTANKAATDFPVATATAAVVAAALAAIPVVRAGRGIARLARYAAPAAAATTATAATAAAAGAAVPPGGGSRANPTARTLFQRMLGSADDIVGASKFLVKKIPMIGTAASLGFGMANTDLKDAGYDWESRAVLGALADQLELFDFGQNGLAMGINGVFGTEFDTDNDLSGAFMDWLTRSNPGIYDDFDPSVSSDGHYVPAQLNYTVPGISPNADGSISVDPNNIDPSTAWRHSQQGTSNERQRAVEEQARNQREMEMSEEMLRLQREVARYLARIQRLQEESQ